MPSMSRTPARKTVVLLEEARYVFLFPTEIDLQETQAELLQVARFGGLGGGYYEIIGDAQAIGIPTAPIGEWTDRVGQPVAALDAATVGIEQRERITAGFDHEITEREGFTRVEPVIAPIEADGEFAKRGHPPEIFLRCGMG